MYSPQTNETILQLTHLKTTVWHFAGAFLLLKWLCFTLYSHIIRFPNGAGFLWVVTLMPVVMWLAECEPGACKEQQEQTGGMKCSPGAVTSTGTWIDFGSSHYDDVCCNWIRKSSWWGKREYLITAVLDHGISFTYCQDCWICSMTSKNLWGKEQAKITFSLAECAGLW